MAIKETRTGYNKDGEMVYQKHRFISAAFDEEKGYLFWVRKRGPRGFSDIDFPKEMTDQEIGKMTRLSKKMWGDTNMLGYKGHGGIKPYDVAGIGKLVGLKRSTAYLFVKKMMGLGMMAKVEVETEERKEVQYYISPLYFFNNSRLSFNLYLIFRKQLDRFLPKWVVQKYREGQ